MQFRSSKDQNKDNISLDKANFCFTDFISFHKNKVAFTVNYELLNFKGRINWFLVEKNPMQIKDKKRLKVLHINHTKETKNQSVHFEFLAESDKVYAVIGQVAPKLFKKSKIEISISTLNAFAQLVK